MKFNLNNGYQAEFSSAVGEAALLNQLIHFLLQLTNLLFRATITMYYGH